MTREERQPFDLMATRDKARFAYEMASYEGPMRVRVGTKTAAKKDDTAPKRPCSAFFAYCKVIRAAVLAKAGTPVMQSCDSAMIFSRMWKDEDPAIKQYFKDQTTAQNKEYKKEMVIHKQTVELEKQQREEAATEQAMEALSTRHNAYAEMDPRSAAAAVAEMPPAASPAAPTTTTRPQNIQGYQQEQPPLRKKARLVPILPRTPQHPTRIQSPAATAPPDRIPWRRMTSNHQHPSAAPVWPYHHHPSAPAWPYYPSSNTNVSGGFSAGVAGGRQQSFVGTASLSAAADPFMWAAAITQQQHPAIQSSKSPK